MIRQGELDVVGVTKLTARASSERMRNFLKVLWEFLVDLQTKLEQCVGTNAKKFAAIVSEPDRYLTAQNVECWIDIQSST